MILYVETSAIMNWLLGEHHASFVISAINKSTTILSSTLTIMETRRALQRAEKAELIKSADHQKVKGMLEKAKASWNLLEVNPQIQSRVGESFPEEPVRTLDAIHLATCLEFIKIYPDLYVLSFDQRILNNLIPLGLMSLKPD